MKLVYLIIFIVISFSIMHGSFAQLISTTDIPSQHGFRIGINPESTPSTETPSQGSFELGTKQMTARSETPSQTIFAADNAESSQISPPVQANEINPIQMPQYAAENETNKMPQITIIISLKE